MHPFSSICSTSMHTYTAFLPLTELYAFSRDYTDSNTHCGCDLPEATGIKGLANNGKRNKKKKKASGERTHWSLSPLPCLGLVVPPVAVLSASDGAGALFPCSLPLLIGAVCHLVRPQLLQVSSAAGLRLPWSGADTNHLCCIH